MDLFVKSIAFGIDSVQVVSELFRGNDELIDRFEDDFVASMADQIANSNHNPDYLRVLASVAQVCCL